MALPILDGNQSATTLSTILSSGQHITAHTVVSLGTQAITDIASAVSGTSVCVGAISISGTPSVTGSVSVLNFPASQSTTFGAVTGSVSVLNFPASQAVTFSAVTISNFPATQTIAGTVTLGLGTQRIGSVTAFGRRTNYTDGIEIPIVQQGDTGFGYGYNDNPFIPIRIITNQNGQASDFVGDNTGGNLPISGTVTVGNTVTIAGTVTANPTGTQTIAGSVTLGAGTAQIGSVTASISGTVPVSISSVTVGNSVTIGSLPAISGTVTANATLFNVEEGYDEAINQSVLAVHVKDLSGNVLGSSGSPLPISGTVTANTFALQGTAVTTSNFTSTTASTVLAGFNAGREVLTIFNEGAGNLHVCAGATCTTIAYQVRLSAGDYYEVPNHQTTITHSAVFATAGTARVVQVS